MNKLLKAPAKILGLLLSTLGSETDLDGVLGEKKTFWLVVSTTKPGRFSLFSQPNCEMTQVFTHFGMKNDSIGPVLVICN